MINKTATELLNVASFDRNEVLSNMTGITPNKEEELVDMDSIKILKTNLNAMFLVIMGTMIIFMQAGFGFLEAGSIRAKNTTNILIKNFADLTFGKTLFNLTLHKKY